MHNRVGLCRSGHKSVCLITDAETHGSSTTQATPVIS